MNKYQKARSREIKDIIRADPYEGAPVSPWRFGRMSYKQARREWKRGIRAFRVGNTWVWKAADMGHLGFDREKLREVGQAYYKIYEFAIRNSYTLDCRYDSYFDACLLKFSGWLPDGQKYSTGASLTSDLLRHYRGSLVDIAENIINAVDREFTKRGYIARRTTIAEMYPPIFRKPGSFPSEEQIHGGFTTRYLGKWDVNKKTEENPYPRMTLHPWDCRSPEAVLGKIIVKE